MVDRLAESERVGLLLVAHAQHVQQCWVNGSHTHFMIHAELDKLEKELDHMHTEWAGLTKENEKMALKLEETGNYGDMILCNLKFLNTFPVQLKNITTYSRKWVWFKNSLIIRRESWFSSGDPLSRCCDSMYFFYSN